MAKKARLADDFDSPWKDALHLFLRAFLAFFFPAIEADIDWPRGYESLDKELQKIARRAKIEKIYADKLFKVWLKDGNEHWLLIHIEVQNEYDAEFARRMFLYNFSAMQMYNRDVVSLAILGDHDPSWRPTNFVRGKWDCKSEVVFRIAKLLDYAGREAELESSDNPFAAVVLAHRKATETQKDSDTRKYWKLRLVKGLYERNWSKEKVGQLFLLIDSMIMLEEELAVAFEEEMAAFEEEKKVRYISSVERHGMEKGRAEGLDKGLAKGLIEGIELFLEDKFGKAGLALVPKIRSLGGYAEVRKFSRFLKKAKSLDEVREYFA